MTYYGTQTNPVGSFATRERKATNVFARSRVTRTNAVLSHNYLRVPLGRRHRFRKVCRRHPSPVQNIRGRMLMRTRELSYRHLPRKPRRGTSATVIIAHRDDCGGVTHRLAHHTHHMI
jgi:hypothetical protein